MSTVNCNQLQNCNLPRVSLAERSSVCRWSLFLGTSPRSCTPALCRTGMPGVESEHSVIY